MMGARTYDFFRGGGLDDNFDSLDISLYMCADAFDCVIEWGASFQACRSRGCWETKNGDH